jgi:hypothetical protein
MIPFQPRQRRSLVAKIARVIHIMAMCVGMCVVSDVQAQSLSDYQVKAAFLYNFAKFVEWPPEAFSDGGAPFVIGVVGEDPLSGDLERIVGGKTANGRRIIVRRLRGGQELRNCHILFISSSENYRLSQIMNSLQGANTLTVGEADEFTRHGGIINFFEENDKLRFKINVNSAERARLKISSRLLALARVVRD